MKKLEQQVTALQETVDEAVAGKQKAEEETMAIKEQLLKVQTEMRNLQQALDKRVQAGVAETVTNEMTDAAASRQEVAQFAPSFLAKLPTPQMSLGLDNLGLSDERANRQYSPESLVGNLNNKPDSSNLVRPLKLASYDGSSTWEDYLAHFEFIAEANGWSLFQKTLQLGAALRGEALSIMSNMEPLARRNFSMLSDALSIRFGTKYQEKVSHTLLRYRVQQPKESLSAFGLDVEKLARKSFTTLPAEALDRIAMMQFIDGIYESEVQDLIRMASPTNLREAMTKAIEITAVRHATRLNQRKIRETVIEVPEFTCNKATVEVATETEAPRRRRRRNHYRQPYGGKLSNQAEPEGRQANAVEINAPAEIKIQATGGAALTADGYLNQQKCRFIVDTGAMISLVNSRFLRGKSTNIRPCNLRVKTMTGASCSVSGIADLIVKLGVFSESSSFVVADITDDAILGTDFLKKFGCQINLENDWFILNGNKIPLSVHTHPAITTLPSEVLPPRSETIVSARLVSPRAGVQLIEHPTKAVRVTRLNTDEERFSRAQQDDDILGQMVTWKSLGTRPTWEQISTCQPAIRKYWAQWDSIVCQGGLLRRKFESSNGTTSTFQTLVPSSLIEEILRDAHENRPAGHFGVAKTKDRIQERFYWYGWMTAVERWCRKCNSCAARKEPHRTTQSARTNLSISTERMMAQYNTKANPVNFEIGDLVWFHNPKRKVGLSPKLENSRTGKSCAHRQVSPLFRRPCGSLISI